MIEWVIKRVYNLVSKTRLSAARLCKEPTLLHMPKYFVLYCYFISAKNAFIRMSLKMILLFTQ